MDHLRVCRCCLSTEANEMSSGKSSAQILKILTGYNPKIVAFWLCYRCKHAMKKISRFRDMCLKADSALREYSTLMNKKQANSYFLEEKNKLNLGNEPSFSNTLCLNVQIESVNSPVGIVSFDRASKLQKNFTKNITTVIHRELKIGISPELDFKKEFKTNEIKFVDSNSEIGIQNTKASCSGNYLETVEKKYQPTEESEMSIDIEVPVKQELIADSAEETEIDLSDGLVESNSTQKSRNIARQPKTSLISREIFEQVEKAGEVVLSIEEQLKEKHDRSKEDSYIKALFKCQLCVLTFHNQAALNNHTKKHCESFGPHECPICSIRFPEFDQLYRHRIKHSLRLICDLCNKRLWSKEAFKAHLVAHTVDYPCPVCGKRYNVRKSLQCHIRYKHGPGLKYRCDTCGKGYASKSTFAEHVQSHSGEPLHTCPICSKTYFLTSSYENHRLSHEEAVAFAHYCVECNLHFKTASLLQRHLKNSSAHCDQSSFKHRCSLCPRGYKSACHLSAHMIAQHNEGPAHVCKTCGQSYSSQRNLLNHIKIKHEGYKPPKIFACPMCDKKFSRGKIVREHIRTHTGERPFKCTQCPSAFSTSTTLATHIKLVHLKISRNVTKKPKAPIKVTSESDTSLDSTKIDVR